LKKTIATAVCAVFGFAILVAPALAATYPNMRVEFPTAGYALTGDGQANFVLTEKQYAYELRTDWQSGRRLFLNITSNNANYPAITATCVTGPEDPGHPANKGYPAMGADFYLSQNRLVANIQCYNAAHSAGYWVSFINPQNCFTVTKTPATDPRFTGGDHFTIDGPNCTATVSIRNGTQVTQITTGGKRSAPVIFNVPIHVEFDTAPS
jgi:hypothetical protein